MKAKIATVASAGLESGKIIDVKIRQVDAPSIRAASSRSRGMVIKNWRSRKMKNGKPNQAGMISGQSVLTSLSWLNKINVGTIVTSRGIMSVPRTMINSRLLARARRRANPKATIEQEIRLPTTFEMVTISELIRKVLNGSTVQPST